MPILFLMLFAGLAIGFGWPIVSLCDRTSALSRSERMLIAFLGGAIVLHFVIWGVGSLRYDATSMWAILAMGAVAALPGLCTVPWQEFRQSIIRLLDMAKRDVWFAGLLIAVSALAFNGMMAGLAPPADYDGINYHLSLPKFDLERGFIAPGEADAFGYLPPLMEMLYRLGLATVGPSAAQLIHGLFGLFAASGTAQLVRRLGFGPSTALCSAIMLLSVRYFVWEFGTTYVELGLAAYSVAALLTYMAWRTTSSRSLMILFGGMLGGAIGVKYHGFPLSIAFGVIICVDVLREPKLFRSVLVGPITAGLLIVPFLVRNYLGTGYPLYLLVGDAQLTQGLWSYRDSWGVGRAIWLLISAPWDLSIFPSRYFDGQLLGAPYLLALAPLAVLARQRIVAVFPAIVILVVYFIEWFWLMSQQVRFLAPIIPIVSALAAVGASSAWSTVSTNPIARTLFILIVAILTAIQCLFVGAYAAIRFPVVLGKIDALTYLTDTPTIQGSHYASCLFISEHLAPGERFAWLVSLRSYYCPQSTLVRPLPSLPAPELAAYLERLHIRYVGLETTTEARDNAEGVTYRHSVDAAPPAMAAILHEVRPKFSEPFAVVYDASDIISALKKP